jgi:hypothetical protein
VVTICTVDFLLNELMCTPGCSPLRGPTGMDRMREPLGGYPLKGTALWRAPDNGKFFKGTPCSGTPGGDPLVVTPAGDPL